MERLSNGHSAVGSAAWMYFENAVIFGKPPPDKDAVQEALEQMPRLYGELGVPRSDRMNIIAALEESFYSGTSGGQISAAGRIIDVRDCMVRGVRAMRNRTRVTE